MLLKREDHYGFFEICRFLVFLVVTVLFSSTLLATEIQKSRERWDGHLKSVEDFYRAGYFSEALERAEEFVEYTDKKFPADHFKQVHARLWLGFMRLQYGELDAAHKNLQSAYEILKSTSPRPPNPDAMVLLYLGRTLQLQKKTDEALKYLYEVAAFNFYGVMEVDPVNFGLAYLYMAEIYFSQKDHKTGLTWLQEASNILLSEYPTYPNLTDGLVELGDYYFLNDDLSSAESTYKRALALHKKLVGGNNPKAADILFKLVQVEYLRKDNSYSRSDYQDHLKELQSLNYDGPKRTLCEHLAALQKQCFFPEKCRSVETLYRDSIKQMSIKSDGTCDSVSLYSGLSTLMKFKNDLKEAERQLVKGSKMAKKSFGSGSEPHKRALNALKAFYEENNQSKKAGKIARVIARLAG